MVRLISANLRPDVPTRSQHEKVRSHSEAVDFPGFLSLGVTSNEGPTSRALARKLMLRCQLPVTYLRLPERRVPPCIESCLPSPGNPLWFHLGLRKHDRCRLMTRREES